MTAWTSTFALSWPLLIGVGISATIWARLREEFRATGLSEPAVVSRALLFFAEGDVLRALVVLEGESHPLCYLLSAFWKQIATPRQWEGISLIAEYQRKVPQLTAPIRREVLGFGQLLAATILLEIGWLAWRMSGWTPAAVGAAFATLLVAVVGALLWRGLNAKLVRLLKQGDQVIYQSIEALDHGRQRPLTIRMEESAPGGGRATPPAANYVSQVYKAN